MNLFVIPVTFRLLTSECRAMNFDLKFAQKKNIPVLPMLMEQGIKDLYSKPECFGELQYIKPNDTDQTAIDYKEKLKNYLESVLISDELAKRIRKAFDAYIFLSYRKKDRKYANDLMKLIHKNPEYEDIAIWFDEFLTPGESFRQNIERILRNSKLFTLLVTPNLVERHKDGTPNFIMKSEYPVARQLGKRILPAEMVSTDKEVLKREFEDIPDCADVSDEDAFKQKLLDSLMDIAVSENNDDPEHNYLIGLAYIKGIDVEVDIERGRRLITKAAKASLPDAMKKLCAMYAEGDGVGINYKMVLFWRKKLYEYYVSKYGEEHETSINALLSLGQAYRLAGDIQNEADACEKSYMLSLKVHGENDPETLTALNNLALAYKDRGDVHKSVETMKKCYELNVKVRGEEDINTLISLNNLSVSYSSAGDYINARITGEKCYVIRERMQGNLHPDTILALNNYALAAGMCGGIKKELELFIKCYADSCRINGKDDPTTILVLGNLSKAYGDNGDYRRALELDEECYSSKCRIYGKYHPESLKTLSNLAYDYLSAGYVNKGIELYEECYERSITILGENHPDTLDALSGLGRAYKVYGDYKPI